MSKCTACNGSGYYDHNGSPPCGACSGTGEETPCWGIELNGIANLLILIDAAEPAVGCDYPSLEEIKAFHDLKPQVELLERYLIAFSIAMDNLTRPPAWHEVLANPSQFPTNRERKDSQ